MQGEASMCFLVQWNMQQGGDNMQFQWNKANGD